MVFVSYIVALFLVCLSLGFLCLFFSKTKMIEMFGYFFLVFSGIILISSSVITSDTILFIILGLYILSLVLLFTFRDELKNGQREDTQRREMHE